MRCKGGGGYVTEEEERIHVIYSHYFERAAIVCLYLLNVTVKRK